MSETNAPTAVKKMGSYRWIICALLFFATTINCIDRQVIGILAPTLGKEIGWNERQYGNIVTCFQIAYAIGLLLSGPLIDRLGTCSGMRWRWWRGAPRRSATGSSEP